MRTYHKDLEHFERGRGYPERHDDLFKLIADTWTCGSFLDVCCGSGLLGQRLIDKLGVMCCGIEADSVAATAAHMLGVQMKIHEMLIQNNTLGLFSRVLVEHDVKTVVMRHCVNELFTDSGIPRPVNRLFAASFVDTLVARGVEEIYLEGRAFVSGPPRPIPNVAAEIEFFLPHYDVQVHRGRCVFLRRRRLETAKQAA